MGLDLVEFILDVEDAFQVAIPEEALLQIDTPGKLIDWLDQELASRSTQAKESDLCLTQQAFYLVRKQLMQQFALSRKSIRPKARLEELIPLENRMDSWRQIQQSIGAKSWPLLTRPVWLKTILGIATILFFCWIDFKLQTILFYSFSKAWMFAIIPSLCFWFCALYFTRSWQLYFQWHYEQIQDLVRFLIAKNMFLFARSSYTRNQIKTVIQEILKEAFSITDFKEEDHFVKDLGLD